MYNYNNHVPVHVFIEIQGVSSRLVIFPKTVETVETRF